MTPQDIDQSAIDALEALRDDSWVAMNNILKSHGISKHDRYAGEFPYPDRVTNAPKLSNAFALGNKAARDSIAKAFQDASTDNGWRDLSVQTKDKAPTELWPYDITFTVTGPSVTDLPVAYTKMAEWIFAVEKQFPQPDRTPWAVYLDGYEVPKEMRFKNAADYQVEQFGMIPKIFDGAELFVVATHSSKSIDLPVVQVEFPRNFTRVTIRNNFHDICVSVEAHFPVANDRNLQGIFNTKTKDGYFEDFPSGTVHDGYDKNPQKFSFTVGSFATLVMMLAEINRQDYSTRPANTHIPIPVKTPTKILKKPIRLKGLG